MIDIQIVRDDPQRVKDFSLAKGYTVDVDGLLSVDEKRRSLTREIEDKRQERNQLIAVTKGQRPSDEQIQKGRYVREEIDALENELKTVEETYNRLIKQVPNAPIDDVPVGSSEDENVVVKTVGEPTHFDFEPKNHWQIGEAKDWIDKERAAKIAGSRFAYIKGGMVRLQFAIVQFVLDTLADETVLQKIITDNNLNLPAKAFTPVLPPALVNTAAYEATGRLDAEEVTYKLADDELWLNASAEHSLCNMYMNEVLAVEELPIRYIGYATSFRREAGSYGKDTEGIFRMHQFDKLEMEVFSDAQTGLEEHRLLVAIQEYLVSQLKLPYRVLQKCTADIGKPNAQGVDIEVWLPGQGQYRETHSADYMTDFQTRSLQTRYRDTDGKVKLAHTNDATALVLSRIPVAILENYQTAEGNVRIPEVLRGYMGNKEEL